VLAAQDRLRVARSNLESATRVLNLIQQRLQAGTASALDTAQQESLVNTQRAAIPPLEQTLRLNRVTLAVLIGRSPESVSIRGGSLRSITYPRVTPGLPSELLAQRPDIRRRKLICRRAPMWKIARITPISRSPAKAAFKARKDLLGRVGFCP
jgi:outer membrane protein TolC